MMIEISGITVKRAHRETLSNATFELPKSKVVGIVGPNGAGKSTLLHVAAGSLQPSSGSASMDGTPLGQQTLAHQAQTRAVMSQHVDMAFPYPVHEVIAMGWEPFRHRRQLSFELLERIAHELAISDLLERRFNELSGGERQRVQFARTCIQIEGISDLHSGGYWLLDEPTASLDIGHELMVLRYLRRTAERGFGIALVVHDLEKAARFCDLIVLLDKGRVAATGEPQEVFTDENLTRVYDTAVTTEWHTGLRRLLIHA
ncbi:MAG: ATP-binding cassette domain-containing protein [Pseudomonadota bacterium]